MEHEQITNCPICGSTSLDPYLRVKDHFLTSDTFAISQCNSCGFKITNPRPGPKHISPYYESPEYISHNTGKNNLINLVYKTVRSINFKSKFKCLHKASAVRLLDYGAGEGAFVKYCLRRGIIAQGVEPSLAARNRAKEINIELLDEIPNASFNNITLWHVLEHVHDLKNTLSNLIDHLDTGGRLIIALPNNESYDQKIYGEYWAAYDVPRHLWHFNESNIIQLIESFGLEHVKTQGMYFDAFYISMMSAKYARRSTLGAILNGLKSNLKAKQSGGYSSQIYIFDKTP